MAKVVLISLYDNWALGSRALSNALVLNDHEVSLIHFKLASHKELADFQKYPLHYENTHSEQANPGFLISGYGIDINMWSNNEIKLLGDFLIELNPDIIGLTTRSIYEEYIGAVMEQMQKVESAVTVAGGFGSTFNPSFYLDRLDYACVGEGETALVKMADAIDDGEDMQKINNLVFRSNGKLKYNDLEKPEDSTEDYLFTPKMEKVSHYVIEDNVLTKTDPFLSNIMKDDPFYKSLYYTICGRSCPLDCSFCSAGKFYQMYEERGVKTARRRNRPVDKIIDEFKYVEDKNFKKIWLMDSYLMGNSRYLIDLFDAYEKNIKIPFFAQFYPEQIIKHPEILEKACQAGLVHTVVGIQSGSERVNEIVFNRKVSNKQTIRFSEILSGYDDLKIDYHLITHNPFEKEEDFEITLQLLAALPKKNSQLILSRLRYFPGSDIEKKITKAGLDPLSMMDTYKKWYILYLIRFFTDDLKFENVYENYKNYSFDELKKIYSDARKALGSPSQPPQLIKEGYCGFNIVRYHEQFYSIAQESGPIDLGLLSKEDFEYHAQQYKLFKGGSLQEVINHIDELVKVRV